MPGTEVTTAKMREVANTVEGIIERYNTSVNSMYRTGDEVDAMWDGEASEKFKSKTAGDRPKFDAMATLLKAYVDTLRSDADIYAKAEQDTLDILNSKLR